MNAIGVALFRLVRATALGALAGTLLAVATLQSGLSPVHATQMDPFRLRGGNLGGGCADWKNDSALWKDGNGDGTRDPFSYWWSGQARFWNLATAHVCWHNDENSPSGDPARPGTDYAGSGGTDVYFWTEHWNSYNWWPGVLFESTGCPGVQARVYSPTGVFLSKVHYWHTAPQPNVIGTNWTYHYDVPGYSLAYRQIADVLSDDPTCTIFGAHLHQSGGGAGGTSPNHDGDIVNSTQFWLTWTMP